ncbi:MAG: 3-isopropylmalate dehydrogenase [Planctomycetes bacterium]|nr:3-isopropylmalate dehydrogenase [Planctomycetota bacterium]
MTYKIGVIGGDGIGPEVVDEGLKVLRVAAEKFGFDFETKDYPWGAEHYLATGEAHPDSVYSEYREMDALLLGAIGDPRIEVGMLERAIIAGIRFKMDLFVNLRPIKCPADDICPIKGKKASDIDMLVIRENTEGAYCQVGGIFKKDSPQEVAIAEMIYTRHGVERVVRYAFEAAKRRPRKHLTLVDKANAIRPQEIWTRVFAEVAREYPDVATDHAYVDAACMWMIKNPEAFDTVVTTNLFGDIITDLGAVLQGGMGVAASGNIHPGKTSMFEPIHGSAPKYKGQNKANPIATVAAVSMMLDHVGEARAAAAIDGAITELIASGRIPDLSSSSGLKTDEIGDLIAGALKEGLGA